MRDVEWPTGRTFVAMQPWRTMMRIAPWWTALFGIAGLIVLATVIWSAPFSDAEGPPVVLVAVLSLVWAAMTLVNVRQMRSTVLAVTVAPAGLVFDRVLGSDVELEVGELSSLGRTRLIPQPGWLCLRDASDRKWHLAPVEDEFALTDVLRSVIES